MYQSKAMQIMQRIYYLAEDLPFLLFLFSPWIFINKIPQTIPLTIFHLYIEHLYPFLIFQYFPLIFRLILIFILKERPLRYLLLLLLCQFVLVILIEVFLLFFELFFVYFVLFTPFFTLFVTYTYVQVAITLITN